MQLAVQLLTWFAPAACTCISVLLRLLKRPAHAMQLNGAKLVPKQSHATKRLERGSLQMAEGTHLLLDESHMKPGRLSATGINNLQVSQHSASGRSLSRVAT